MKKQHEMTAAEFRAHVKQSYDTGAAGYASNWSGPYDWLEEERDEFASRVAPGATVLDLGCNVGHDAAYWTERGYRVTGVDISEEAIALAKRAHPGIEFLVHDALALVDLGRVFDAVWASYSLLHIPADELDNALDQVHRVLKQPDGCLFVAMAVETDAREELTVLEGLVDAGGEIVEVPIVRWGQEALRAKLSERFEEVWSRNLTPIPGRGAYSGIYRPR